MRAPTHPMDWRQMVGLALLFAGAAAFARLALDYPRCQNDELNWVAIAAQLDQGVAWPVSGPAFIAAARTLSQVAQWPQAQAMAVLGVAGVAVAVVLLLFGYRCLGLAAPGRTLLVLTLSSHFWAPLLEARPQQWGQTLVFCGVIGCWLWLRRQGGVWFFGLLPALAFTHILSHAILLFLCGVLVLVHGGQRQGGASRRHVVVVLALLGSLAVYALPQGPYAAMLGDVMQMHWRRVPLIESSLALLASLGLGWTVWWAWRRWGAVLPMPMLKGGAEYARRRWRGPGLPVVVALLLVAGLTMQAAVLPAAAWSPYGGSTALFGLLQLGNVLFAVLVLAGLPRFAAALRPGGLDTSPDALLAWMLLSLGLLSMLALGVSPWLLDTNWLLRLIDYSLPFAAVVAAAGLQRLWASALMPLGATLMPLGVAASLVSVLRLPGVVGC